MKRHLTRLWPLVLALVALNAGVILALALGSNEGAKLESSIRAAAEGEGEEEEGLGPAEPDDYFLFQRSTGGKLPSTGDSPARCARRRPYAPPARAPPPRANRGRSRARPTSAAA